MLLLIWLVVMATTVMTVEAGCNRNLQVKRNNLIGTISSLPAVHIVSFSVKPTAFSKGYSNVIHFTTSGNTGIGSRIPGVWFDYDKLHISGSVNGNGNFWINSPSLPKDKWAQVTIIYSKVQKPEGRKNYYEVYVNGKKIVGAQNPTAKEYKNVKVYMTDPWYSPFAGSICNLMIAGSGVEGIKGNNLCRMTLFSLVKEVTPTKGKGVGTISTLPAVHTVSFSVKPTAFSKGYTNVLHFTTSGNTGIGSRIPGVWFDNDKLHISGSVNGNGNYWVNYAAVLKDQWTDVTIINTKVGSQYIYEVFVNGKSIVRTVNSSAKEYKNVKVYVSDVWYQQFQGSIRNIVVSVPGSFGCN